MTDKFILYVYAPPGFKSVDATLLTQPFYVDFVKAIPEDEPTMFVAVRDEEVLMSWSPDFPFVLTKSTPPDRFEERFNQAIMN